MRIFELSPEERDLLIDTADFLGLKTNAELTVLLNVMMKQGKVTRAWDTERNKEQLIQDLAKHYNVAVIKGR